MSRLYCVRGQRDASGYDFWYEGRADDGREIVISATRMKERGHLLVDKWDAQEWAEWLSVQEPFTPYKPSPRLTTQ